MYSKIEFTNKQELEICELYRQGNSLRKIGTNFSCNRHVISKILEKNNITIRSNLDYKRTLSDVEIKEIINLYQSGITVPFLAKQYSFCNGSILYVLNKNNIDTSKKNKLNKNQELEMCDLYTQGKNSTELSKLYSISSSRILEILRKNNIQIRTIGESQTLIDKSLHEGICNRYIKGETSVSIAENYNVNYQTIIRILTQYNIEIRQPQETSRKYTLNEKYFDVIDTEDKAYFLGYEFGDGYNDCNGRVVLTLQIQDKTILLTFNEYLETDKPLYYSEGTEHTSKENGKTYQDKDKCTLSINSLYLSKRLEEIGMLRCKSLTVEYPSNQYLPENKYAAFIRGIFDADGCISYVQRGNSQQYKFNILSSEVFLDRIEDIFIELDIKTCLRYKKGKISELRINHIRDILRMYHYMYNNCNPELMLKRKYDKFQQLIKYVKTNWIRLEKKIVLNDNYDDILKNIIFNI